jgi:cytoskeletal protein CcmA (bactofilin family)
MATYVNDLRLKEIGTGESSGTWGSETNTNLELIGEALGFGTEAITTNADTHTTTVADGSTDPGRAIYLKYTGTLDSACTITIAPNTMSRMHFIENGTSGSQNIIISQGTGANVTIPPGDTKAVYLDGAGSGAAVVDAFASLNVVDLKVQDDLTVTDDATIGGTLGVTGVLTATSLDISGDIDVDGTTNLDVVDIDGAVDMASTLAVGGVVTANAGVVVDNITIDGTEIDLSSGNLTLDVAGTIKLDADGGEVAFLDAGTEVGVVSMGSSNMNIESKVADKDIIFKGIDGSSDVTALTLDMSAAGAASFNSTITMPSGGALLFGERGNLTHDASSYDMTFNTNGLSNTLVITGDGKIGIGTTSPDTTLEVKHNDNAGNRQGLVGDGATTGSALWTNWNTGSSYLDFRLGGTSSTYTKVRIDSSGNLLVGRTSAEGNTTGLALQVNAANKYCSTLHNNGDATNRYGLQILAGTYDNSGTNTHVAFADGNGDGVGTITSSGGTVTYGAFTAHHEVNVPDSDNPSDDSDAYPYGTLVEIVSVYLTDSNKRQSIRYTVQKSQSANSKKVLGAYASNMRSSPMCPTTGTYANNLHNISILGDGHILCNNSGGNIEVGDGICTSAVEGIGMKATTNPSMIVAIAQEDVTFSGSETKLVAVQFGVQQFTPWS